MQNFSLWQFLFSLSSGNASGTDIHFYLRYWTCTGVLDHKAANSSLLACLGSSWPEGHKNIVWSFLAQIPIESKIITHSGSSHLHLCLAKSWVSFKDRNFTTSLFNLYQFSTTSLVILFKNYILSEPSKDRICDHYLLWYCLAYEEEFFFLNITAIISIFKNTLLIKESWT